VPDFVPRTGTVRQSNILSAAFLREDTLMDDGARGWLAKAARKNYWRVSRWYDLDDVIQEGYAAYYDTIRRYPDATDPPHRMALFKRVFMSRLHDLANKRTRSVNEVTVSDLCHGSVASAEVLFETVALDNDISAAAGMLATAPQYVRDAIALFATEDGLRRLRSAYRKVRRGKYLVRETLNERLCRLTGNDPRQVDIVQELRACLTQE